MNFTRKKRRGRTQDQYQEWLSDDGHYRVTWSSMFPDKDMPDTFYACVNTVRHHVKDDFEYWNFAGKRGPYRTMKKAIEACEDHLKAWQAFFKIMAGPYKGRADLVRNLIFKTTTSLDKEGNAIDETVNKILSTLPKWVRDQGNSDAYRILFEGRKRSSEDEDEDECPQSVETTECPDQPDPTPILPTIDDEPVKEIEAPKCSSKRTPKRGPAPVVTDGPGPSIKAAHRSSRKGSAHSPEPAAPPATPNGRARKKPASKPTKRQSASGKRKRTTTTT